MSDTDATPKTDRPTPQDKPGTALATYPRQTLLERPSRGSVDGRRAGTQAVRTCNLTPRRRGRPAKKGRLHVGVVGSPRTDPAGMGGSAHAPAVRRPRPRRTCAVPVPRPPAAGPRRHRARRGEPAPGGPGWYCPRAPARRSSGWRPHAAGARTTVVLGPNTAIQSQWLRGWDEFTAGEPGERHAGGRRGLHGADLPVAGHLRRRRRGGRGPERSRAERPRAGYDRLHPNGRALVERLTAGGRPDAGARRVPPPAGGVGPAARRRSSTSCRTRSSWG